MATPPRLSKPAVQGSGATVAKDGAAASMPAAVGAGASVGAAVATEMSRPSTASTENKPIAFITFLF
jgi:hypothetical protein